MSAVILTPHISEKAIALAEKGTYVFQVPTSANKIEVAKAVEAGFNVKVDRVTMLILKGKTVNWRGKGGKRSSGTRSNMKKAMVTLQKGQSIALFEEGSK